MFEIKNNEKINKTMSLRGRAVGSDVVIFHAETNKTLSLSGASSEPIISAESEKQKESSLILRKAKFQAIFEFILPLASKGIEGIKYIFILIRRSPEFFVFAQVAPAKNTDDHFLFNKAKEAAHCVTDVTAPKQRSLDEVTRRAGKGMNFATLTLAAVLSMLTISESRAVDCPEGKIYSFTRHSCVDLPSEGQYFDDTTGEYETLPEGKCRHENSWKSMDELDSGCKKYVKERDSWGVINCICLECKEGTTHFLNGICRNGCDGTSACIFAEFGYIQTFCSQNNCSECTNTGMCKTCNDGYLYQDGRCRSKADGCSSGYIENNGKCEAIPDSNSCPPGKVLQGKACVSSCGSSFRLNDGECDRIRYTPAEAAEVLKDTDNEIIMTFKVNR